jgi:hypothetical protein
MQLDNIVSITTVLKSECVNTRIAKRRKQLNGENIKRAGVELNRNIVLLRLTTTNTYDCKNKKQNVFFFQKILHYILCAII